MVTLLITTHEPPSIGSPSRSVIVVDDERYSTGILGVCRLFAAEKALRGFLEVSQF